MVSSSTVALSLSVVWSESDVTCMRKKPGLRANIFSLYPPCPQRVRRVGGGTSEISLVTYLCCGISDSRRLGVLRDGRLGYGRIWRSHGLLSIRGRGGILGSRWFLDGGVLFPYPLLRHLVDHRTAACDDRALDDLILVVGIELAILDQQIEQV